MFEETSNTELIDYLTMLNIKLNIIDSVETFGYRKTLKNGAYILNIDKDINDETKGTHWTCFYCFNQYCIYIDSYGMRPPEKIKRWLYKHNDSYMFIFNPHQIQSLESLACGYYCIYFLYHMNKRKKEMRSMKSCHRILNEMLEPFNYNNNSNDDILKHKLEEIFM